MRLYKLFLRIPLPKAHAHCDVPCGIYDPKTAQIAAATVMKMVEKMTSLQKPNASDVSTFLNYKNTMTRCILVKEEHARKCKEELFILWADFFKNEHLSRYPDLHTIFWETVKLCSKNKQEVSLEAAEELVKKVDEISEMVKSIQGNK